MAEYLSAALKRQIAFVDIPSEQMREAMVGFGMPAWQVDGLIEDYAHYQGINSGSREVPSNRPTAPSSEITTATTERTDPLRDSPQRRLRQRIEQISQAAQGRVGMTATVLESGESVSLNGNQRFPMQSVYKLPIAMAVLNQVDQGNLKPDQKIRIEASDIVQGSQLLDENSQGKEFSLSELLQYMVSNSDNTACDVLLRLIGEPQRVTEYLSNLGINDIVVANTEPQLI